MCGARQAKHFAASNQPAPLRQLHDEVSAIALQRNPQIQSVMFVENLKVMAPQQIGQKLTADEIGVFRSFTMLVKKRRTYR
ncbi:MAG TPA: hypothetical protein DCE46_02920, partial [Pantoea sp.]|nr:hypothetical protein [Pantoea sp.]